MAKVMGLMGSSEPFSLFPPSDRELALRAQIKIGWSTHSSDSYVYHQHGLTDHEVKLIQEVVEKAQEIERMEEIRIGLLMLKHKQMIENCRGDGVSTCHICDHDFTHQRSSQSDPIQHCHDCCMVICRRCEIKNPRKIPGGDEHTLCVVCYEERELWKKSGAWLVHSVPHMSISYEELEDIQQQRIKNDKVALGLVRKRVDVLVNPYQIEEEDSDDEEAMQVTFSPIKSQLHLNRSQNRSATLQPKVSPLWFPSESKLRSHSLVLSNSATMSSSDFKDESKLRSHSLVLSNSATMSSSDFKDKETMFQTVVKTSNLSRLNQLDNKETGLGLDNMLQQYKERMCSPSTSASDSRSISSSSYSEICSTDHDGSAASPLDDCFPSIQVSKKTVKTLGSSSIFSSEHASPVPKKNIDVQPNKAQLEKNEDVRAFDEFKKVKSITVRQEAEVKKTSVPTFTTAEKRELSDTGSVAVGDVGEFKGKSDSKSTHSEKEMFKKVCVSSSDTQARKKILPTPYSIGPPPSGPLLPNPQFSGPLPPGPSHGTAHDNVQEDPKSTKTTKTRMSLIHRNTRYSRKNRPLPLLRVGDKKDTGRLCAENFSFSPPTSRSPLTFEEMEDVDGGISQQHPTAYANSATSQDKIKASVAVLNTSSKMEGEVSLTKWKPDGSFGSVQLMLQYSDETLIAIVNNCKGLRAMDSNGLSDPYVKLFIIPGTKMIFQTKVVPKNLDPVFQESFSFTNLTLDAMQKKTLCVVAMDYDGFSRDDFIGATQIKLYEVLNSDNNEISVKRLFDSNVPKSDVATIDRGEIHLSIQYSSERNGLVVNVLSTRNIAEQLHSGKCEAFVKGRWTTRTQDIKRRTKLSPKSNKPEFNEEMFFPAVLHELSYSSLAVGVWEHRSFKDKLLSEVHFKSFSYWKQHVSDPEQVVQDWYALEAPTSNLNSYKRK